MAKSQPNYQCIDCESLLFRWVGRCPTCKSWNTVEAKEQPPSVAMKSIVVGKPTPLLSTNVFEIPRKYPTVSRALDEVLDGGVFPGSVVLLGGEPGVGKSTLALQISDGFVKGGHGVLYLSSEETESQVSTRAHRLKLGEGVDFLSVQRISDVLGLIGDRRYDVMLIDSLQSISRDEGGLSSSSAQFLRSMMEEIAVTAKQSDKTVVVLSQINKEGSLLGPKALEHIVDTVICLEGDRDDDLRVLRVTKNRFGRAPATSMLRMGATGLRSVSDLERSDLAGLSETPGRVMIPVAHGSRLRIMEIQALVLPDASDSPKRTICEGIELHRLQMVMGILEKFVGVRLSSSQVFVQVTGGFKVTDPLSDLGLAVALASSLSGVALPKDESVFGELNLLGEVRLANAYTQRVGLLESVGLKLSEALVALPGKERKDAPKLRGVLESLSMVTRQVRAVG